MNALVKKEIRLLLPSWIVALLLALPPVCTRSDDGIPVFLLFMGLVVMALTSIGRETGLNTFSQLLAQPVERMRLWQTKLSVLAAAFLTVFGVWRLAAIFSFHDYEGRTADPDATQAVLVAGCLIVVATFSGGLWATLLLRQIAGAFWLAVLVPAVLAGMTAAAGTYFSDFQSEYDVIVRLCLIIALYSIGGFLLARWLFFRAQDAGWTGGIIALPEWKFFAAHSAAGEEVRCRRPILALLKKEFQLQQVSLMGAAGLLVMHVSVIVLRANHKFEKDSAGEVLTSIFWMLWLALPVLVGAMSVAEERRLGVMEGQLCLPASRRGQFALKGFLTLFLGVLLGGVIPMLLESAASGWGGKNEGFSQVGASGIQLAIVGLTAWLALVSFFASSLAKNFLQAVGFAIATFVGSAMIFPLLANGRMIFFDSIPPGSMLPLVIAVPTLMFSLLWLAYLNFKYFLNGWALWRRNLLGLGGAAVFAIMATSVIYNRAWEVFEPAEPAHGAAKFSLMNPPVLKYLRNNVQVQLADGRIWVNQVSEIGYDKNRWRDLWGIMLNPLPKSRGARIIAGSNWVSVVSSYYGFGYSDGLVLHAFGIRNDGTLWTSTNALIQSDAELIRFGNESNWQQLAASPSGVLLLKTSGTLWQWRNYSSDVGKRVEEPKGDLTQLGSDSKWQELYSAWPVFVRKADRSVCSTFSSHGQAELQCVTNLDQVDFETLSFESGAAYVRTNGTLWLGAFFRQGGEKYPSYHFSQVGKETNWQAVAVNNNMMVALQKDGTLWEWNFPSQSVELANQVSPTRLGIHSDWVAITKICGGTVALAADGSLWLWPDRKFYDYGLFMKLPKQPQLLGNVFSKAE